MIDTRKYKAVPVNHMILGENQYFSKDCYETKLNNNVLVVGTSGAGKTRYIVKPNLLQPTGSYVISDPKGSLSKTMGPYLEKLGYRVIKMDFIKPERSLRYNPIGYCKTTQDVQRLAHTLVYELSDSTRTIDPFWDQATMILLMAVIGYMLETDELTEEEKNLTTLSSLIVEANRSNKKAGGGFFGNDDTRDTAPLEQRMERHALKMLAKGQESWAVKRFREFNSCANRTHATIIITSLAKLAMFDTIEIREMIRHNDLDFSSIGQEPTALFVEISDNDRSMDVLANLFYSQLVNQLCDYADSCEGSCLPVPVQFILDDFATNARIDNFQNIIANIRSRGISAMIMVQSEAQLYAGYGDDAQTIIDNCNTYVYMGGSNPDMADKVAMRANVSPTAVLNMPLSTSWIFRRGQAPVMCNNFDLEWFEKVKGYDRKCKNRKEPLGEKDIA